MPLSPFHAMVDRESRDRKALLYQVYLPTINLPRQTSIYRGLIWGEQIRLAGPAIPLSLLALKVCMVETSRRRDKSLSLNLSIPCE